MTNFEGCERPTLEMIYAKYNQTLNLRWIGWDHKIIFKKKIVPLKETASFANTKLLKIWTIH